MRLRYYPDPILKTRGKPVTFATGAPARELAAGVEEMFQIMGEAAGIGLAAPQVGWSVRVFVTHIPVGQTEGDRRVYINPEIVEATGSEEDEEGCLSFPGLRGRVARHTRVLLRAYDLGGRQFEEEGVGLTARCWEHEIDHIDGILFLSRMSAGDRLAIKSGLQELEEKYEESRRRAAKGARS